MSYRPMTRDELDEIVVRDLADCSDEQRSYFYSVTIEPTRWRQSPWADDIGGLWAVAVDGNRVLWYNEFEEGFNVSRFTEWGAIPDDEYWCNQDPIKWALPKLATGVNPNGDWGPPRPL